MPVSQFITPTCLIVCNRVSMHLLGHFSGGAELTWDQISDLLASITGEKPKPSTASSTATATKATVGGPVKRKADEDISGGSAQKTQRTTAPLANGSVKPSDAVSASPRQGDRQSYAGSASLRGPNNQTNSSQPSSSLLARKPMNTPSKPSPTSASLANGPKPGILKSPSMTRPNPPASAKSSSGAGEGSSNKSQPKKGSYAEIMARAKAAQANMSSVGKIQHKALDKVPTKREREELKAEQTKSSRRGTKPHSAKPGHARSGTNGAGALRDPDLDRHKAGKSPLARGRESGKSTNGKTAKITEDDKKLKKAATATTGYTGTARPPPGASRSGSSSKPTAPNGSRDRHHESRPYGAFSARRSRDDDYDEELDDFIEYDDDEPELPGDRRRGYGDYSDEEDESDMEAGLSDIDVEERRAEVYARQEDRREEALEKRLKLEKEARKRRFLEGR